MSAMSLGASGARSSFLLPANARRGDAKAERRLGMRDDEVDLYPFRLIEGGRADMRYIAAVTVK